MGLEGGDTDVSGWGSRSKFCCSLGGGLGGGGRGGATLGLGCAGELEREL